MRRKKKQISFVPKCGMLTQFLKILACCFSHYSSCLFKKTNWRQGERFLIFRPNCSNPCKLLRTMHFKFTVTTVLTLYCWS